MEKRKASSTLVVVLLLIAVFSHIFVFPPLLRYCRADPGDISESWDNSTTLNVTVLQLQPRVNWYDFQFYNGSAWVSRLNQQIDVNESAEYRFVVNISSDQGWDDIEYMWINAWADLGDDTSDYNGTLGGNINLNITYDNSTETASAFMAWPTNGSEVTFNGWSEVNVTGSDPLGSPGNTETYNLTFTWVPSYQFRYASDPTNTTAGYNDLWSWNFNITILDEGGYYSYDNPTVGETINEFGVYSYTEIIFTGWPTITGNPGDDPAENDSAISIGTRSNGNYSLSVNVTNLTHKQTHSYWIDNSSIWTAGGELGPLTKFSGTGPHYYYNGSGAGYTAAEKNDTSKVTNDIWWGVTIDIGQYPGDYEATIYYHLQTQTF